MHLVNRPLVRGFFKNRVKVYKGLMYSLLIPTFNPIIGVPPIVHLCLEVDLFSRFLQLPKSYPEFSLLPRPWCSNHTSHAMRLNIQWLRLVPSPIFPVSLAVSPIAFDRSQAHHNTLGLSRRLKKLPQTQIFGGWAGIPLPYVAFNWKQHIDSNLF